MRITIFIGARISIANTQKNVLETGEVFLVIYDSTVDAGMGEGVYLKAHAIELENPKEIEYAHTLLQARRPVPYWKLEQVQGKAPVRLYKAVPEKVWLNDEGEANGTYIDIRATVDLLKINQTKVGI